MANDAKPSFSDGQTVEEEGEGEGRHGAGGDGAPQQVLRSGLTTVFHLLDHKLLYFKLYKSVAR